MLKEVNSISILGNKKFHIDKNKVYIISILLFCLGGFLAYFVRLNLVFTILTSLMGLTGLILWGYYSDFLLENIWFLSLMGFEWVLKITLILFDGIIL